MLHVGSAGGSNAGGIFKIVMAVVVGIGLVGQGRSRVTRVPQLVHHLHIELLRCCNTKFFFDGVDSAHGSKIVGVDHGCYLADGLERLVNDLNSVHGIKVGIGMGDVGHPLEPLIGALILAVNIKASSWSILSSEWLLRLLGTRCTMKIENKTKPCILRPST